MRLMMTTMMMTRCEVMGTGHLRLLLQKHLVQSAYYIHYQVHDHDHDHVYVHVHVQRLQNSTWRVSSSADGPHGLHLHRHHALLVDAGIPVFAARGLYAMQALALALVPEPSHHTQKSKQYQ